MIPFIYQPHSPQSLYPEHGIAPGTYFNILFLWSYDRSLPPHFQLCFPGNTATNISYTYPVNSPILIFHRIEQQRSHSFLIRFPILLPHIPDPFSGSRHIDPVNGPFRHKSIRSQSGNFRQFDNMYRPFHNHLSTVTQNPAGIPPGIFRFQFFYPQQRPVSR